MWSKIANPTPQAISLSVLKIIELYQHKDEEFVIDFNINGTFNNSIRSLNPQHTLQWPSLTS